MAGAEKPETATAQAATATAVAAEALHAAEAEAAEVALAERARDSMSVSPDAEIVYVCRIMIMLASASGETCAALGDPEVLSQLEMVMRQGPVQQSAFLAMKRMAEIGRASCRERV